MHKCHHGIDSRFCACCQPATAGRQVAQSAAVSGRRRLKPPSVRANTLLQLDYQGTPPLLHIWGRPLDDWRLRKKVHAFSAVGRIDGLNDQDIRVRLSALPRRRPRHPSDVDTFRKLTASAPVSLPHSSQFVAGVTLEIQSSCCHCQVPLFDDSGRFRPELNWRLTRQGKPSLHRRFFISLPEIDQSHPRFNELPREWGGLKFLVDENGNEVPAGDAWYQPFDLELQLLVVAQPPKPKPDPIYFDWERWFFPGGLPSLGKRRP